MTNTIYKLYTEDKIQWSGIYSFILTLSENAPWALVYLHDLPNMLILFFSDRNT